MVGQGLTGDSSQIQVYVLFLMSLTGVDIRCIGCRWEWMVFPIPQVIDVGKRCPQINNLSRVVFGLSSAGLEIS